MTMGRGGQTAPFAITCGIYGWMMYTRFLGTESESQAGFENMQGELAKILAAMPLNSDPEADAKSQLMADAISAFVERFP